MEEDTRHIVALISRKIFLIVVFIGGGAKRRLLRNDREKFLEEC